MDTFKIGACSDAPASLEKGHSETQPLHSEASHPPARASTGRRPFVRHPWIIFGTLALTWLVLSCGKRAINRPYHAWRWVGGTNVGFRPPADGDLRQCVDRANWTFYDDQPPWALGYPYGAEAAFSLPLDSDVLYLISRGAFQQGQVNIEQSTEVADAANVRVRVAYGGDDVLERTTVCRVEGPEKEYGVGVFTPRWARHPPHHHEPLQFDITLTLPAGNDGPLSVKKLETQMPNYSQTVADLQESVLFDSISLMSANGKLSVQSLTSEIGQFSSLNGEIEGHFNVRSSLDLRTTNGRIALTVNLLHREGTDPSNLELHTINGQIHAEVSLTSEASVGGEFEVYAGSSNGEIGLKFARTPVESVLRCRAETIVGSVEVELDSAFEGTYALQNLLGEKTVSQRDVEDPAGKGRRRVVSQHKAFGQVDGELKWVDSDGSSSGIEGDVVLKTTVSSVELVV